MWILLPILVLLGLVTFSYPIAKQVWSLASTADHWVLLAVASIGLHLFIHGIRKFQWRVGRRPLAIYSSICLVFCLAIAFVAIWRDVAWVAVAAGIFYFGTLIASGMTKAEWRVVRPYGSLLFLLASPIDADRSSFVNGYKQIALKCASTLLDALQVRNVVDGDRIEGLASSVDWSDVATGFWSNSALLAAVSLAIVWQQLRLIHGVFLLPLTVVIGMLMMIGRAAVIVAKNSDEWLMLFNFLSFAIAAYLAWACLCLVRFVFDPIRGKFSSSIVPWWNRRTVAGLALLRLRNEKTVLDATNTDSYRLPTIEAIHQASMKKRSWLRRLARAFRRGFIQSFIFINDWCRSRRYRRLLPLVPIMLVGIAVLLSPNFRPQFAWSEDEVSEQYAVEVGAALNQGDRSALELLAKRLMQFSSASDPSKYSLSQALLAIDEVLDADAILTKLADDPVNPYAPAQLCMAKRLLAAQAQPSAAVQSQVKHYLRESLRDPLLAPEANWMLGKIYLQSENEESALVHFRSIPKPLPETSLLLAVIYNRRGDRTAYLRCLRNAENACKELLLTPDQSSHQVRLLLARSLQLQGRFSDAMKALEESPDFAVDPVAREAAIIVDLAWYDSLPLDRQLERQERIQHATKLDANHPLVKKAMAAIAVNETNERIREYRQRASDKSLNAKATDGLSEDSRTTLEANATEIEKYDAAERQLREAIAAGIELPLVFHNLAWLLARKPDPLATEESLVMINRALSMSTNQAEFWKTRAEICEKKGLYLDAIADLEKAIQCGDQTPEVRLTLAKLYDLQGDPQTAEKYRKQVPKESSK